MPDNRRLLQYATMNKHRIEYISLATFALVLSMFGNITSAANVNITKTEYPQA